MTTKLPIRKSAGQEVCGGADCCLTRRDLISSVALTALLSALPLPAGPFEPADFQRLVPPDKKLNPEWLRSLFERGQPDWYEGAALEMIGMPVGGICAGQVYLTGDGALKNWDVFNRVYRSGVDQYAHPTAPTSPLDQGFQLSVRKGDSAQLRTIDRRGFRQVRFRGEYPIGYVEYRDPSCPVEVSLRAFSPFIPLDAANSSLPLVVMDFAVNNTSLDTLEVDLAGWLENFVCPFTGGPGKGRRRNRVLQNPRLTFIEGTADGEKLQGEPDFGSMGIGLLDFGRRDKYFEGVPLGMPLEVAFGDERPPRITEAPFGQPLRAVMVRRMTLAPGKVERAVFLLAWHFAALVLPDSHRGALHGLVRRNYGNRFQSAGAVAAYVAENFEGLAGQTLLWHDTWYDATLPYWFLDRTFCNTSILATNTCYWLGNGRFYGYEGVGCCEGTCTSVWHYAHSVARLFPELERSVREMQDYTVGFDPQTGGINHRGEFLEPALDGQAGTILRAFREHQMSADSAFLRRHWPRIRRSVEWLIAADREGDGIIEGLQSTTLDTGNWYGAMSWTSSLYLAALRAAEEMAREMSDEDFAHTVRSIVERGRPNIIDRLWNGEYFIHKPDLGHADGFIIGNGCHIDQVFGDSWAWQVALGRILPEDKVKSALRAIWKYNFTPDVGPYRSVNKAGRWYALPGEGGVILTTWPKGDRVHPKGKVSQIGTGYLNECMTGFEYQVAGHLIWEGMLTEGLAITRMIHDRYHPLRRNPWNEIECGDHYSRAMASYGVYIAACGYEYHGPKGRLAFAPRIHPDDYRAAFTAAEGWGTFSQKSQGNNRKAAVEMKWGKLRLQALTLGLGGSAPANVRVTLDGKALASTYQANRDSIAITLVPAAIIEAGQKLEVAIG